MLSFLRGSTFYKILSYFKPITLQVIESKISGQLQIVLFNGELSLATKNAFYSYGTKYAPFNIAFKYLQNKNLLPKANSNFLLLGGALCSGPQIALKKYKLNYNYTVVEIDEALIEVAQSYLPQKLLNSLNFKCQDAVHFVNTTQIFFDIVAVDVFNDLEVPLAIDNLQFYKKCKQMLTPNGIFIMNFYSEEQAKTSLFIKNIINVWPQAVIQEEKKSLIVIATS